MAETKYGKYFIFETPTSPLHPVGTMPWTPLMRIDNSVSMGSFYFECIWITGTIPLSKAYKPHSHDIEEYVGFFGGDSAEPYNLHAEIQLWMDDEVHTINRNCVVCVPPGVWHTPVVIAKLEKPIFCFSASPMKNYIQKINPDPKWSHLPDPPEGKQLPKLN